MVELAYVILSLSIEVLVSVILAQLLKATSREKTAWQGSHGVIATRKLHCFVGPTHLGVSAPTKRPRDVDEEAGGQRPADAKARGIRAGGQRDQIQSPNQEFLSHEAKTWAEG